jgi:glyoxylate/hydroxypyruvate reductase A
MTFLYKADPTRGIEWATLFASQAPDLPFRIWPDVGDPSAVRYLATWVPPDDFVSRFPNLEILFSVGAGVDQFDFASLPPTLPLVRMVEPGVVGGMVDYVTLAVLAFHRDLPTYMAQQRQKTWAPLRVHTPARRRVGVLGLGQLGQAVLARLTGMGFDCAGWSRSRRDVTGVACFAGEGELDAFLARTDYLVCLLPLTDETRGFLDTNLFARLPKGAVVINCGRGGHLVAEDLLAALESGQVSAAMLDVTDPEPLPPEHPFWEHPRIVLTPHVASMTQPETGVRAVLDNIRRHKAGEPLIGLVDTTRGY